MNASTFSSYFYTFYSHDVRMRLRHNIMRLLVRIDFSLLHWFSSDDVIFHVNISFKFARIMRYHNLLLSWIGILSIDHAHVLSIIHSTVRGNCKLYIFCLCRDWVQFSNWRCISNISYLLRDLFFNRYGKRYIYIYSIE